VGNWAARTSWRTAQGRHTNGQTISDTESTILCEAALAVILTTGRVERNPGPGVEAKNILQVLCSACERNLNTMRHVWTLVSQQL
jgi:hypothetical protein